VSDYLEIDIVIGSLPAERVVYNTNQGSALEQDFELLSIVKEVTAGQNLIAVMQEYLELQA